MVEPPEPVGGEDYPSRGQTMLPFLATVAGCSVAMPFSARARSSSRWR